MFYMKVAQLLGRKKVVTLVDLEMSLKSKLSKFFKWKPQFFILYLYS